MNAGVSNRGWVGKVSAGLICGFLLGLGISGLFKYLVDAGPALYGIESMVSIQLFPIVWTPIVSFCFLFPSTRSAWLWLGLTTVLLWVLLLLLGVTP